MKKILLLLSASLLFLANGCQEEDEALFPNVAIVKELPKIYITEVFEAGDTKIVQSKTELISIFEAERLLTITDLNDIDFTKNTLLLGYIANPYQVASLQHSFTQTNNFEYTYSVRLEPTDAPAFDEFMYGVIVEKIPFSADIIFNIQQ